MRYCVIEAVRLPGKVSKRKGALAMGLGEEDVGPPPCRTPQRGQSCVDAILTTSMRTPGIAQLPRWLGSPDDEATI